MKANQAKAGQTIVVHGIWRPDTNTVGDVTVQVSHDVRYGQFQSWDDASCYIHGTRDDGASYPVWIYDLADVELVS
jgi:hypothetical protein